jgi:hypothetical protein
MMLFNDFDVTHFDYTLLLDQLISLLGRAENESSRVELNLYELDSIIIGSAHFKNIITM